MGPKPNPLASLMPMLTVAAALAYAALAYFMLLKPKIALVIAGGELDVSATEQRVTDDEEYLKRLEAAKVAFSKLNAERRAKIAGIVPTGPDVPGLFVQTDAVAARNGFALLSIDAVVDEKAVTLTGRKSVRVSANFAGGNYQQFKILLADLENALRVSDVRSVAFAAGATGFGVTFNAYFIDSPGTPAVTTK